MPAAALLLTLVHALAGAAWFGSMFYSLTVLHPRAGAYFRGQDPEAFETFIATLAQGARWKVLGAFVLVFASGVGLVLLHRPASAPTTWLGLIAAKLILFLAALAVFCYASWRLWPARIFATPEEVPIHQRRFRVVGLLMTTLVGLNFALGVVAHAAR